MKRCEKDQPPSRIFMAWHRSKTNESVVKYSNLCYDENIEQEGVYYNGIKHKCFYARF